MSKLVNLEYDALCVMAVIVWNFKQFALVGWKASFYHESATKASALCFFREMEGTKYHKLNCSIGMLYMWFVALQQIMQTYLGDPGLMKRFVRIKSFDVKLLLIDFVATARSQ